MLIRITTFFRMHQNKKHFSSLIFTLILISNVEAGDPKGTPLDELLRKQDTVCKGINKQKIDEARLGWSQCIDEFILRPSHDLEEFEELRQYYSYFCRDQHGFKKCWKNVTTLLNSCERNRGHVAQKLYFAIYDLTCANNGSDTASNIIKSVEYSDDLCELNYLTKTCNETRKNWYSIDLCRRYEAQKICEEKAIASCTNSVHKQVLLENLDKIGSSLGCSIQQSGKASNNSSSNFYAIIFLFICIWYKSLT